IGPSLTFTRPVKSSPVTESRAAPGMQGAIRSMSSSTRQASSIGTGTVNEFSNCTVLPPGGQASGGHGSAGPPPVEGGPADAFERFPGGGGSTLQPRRGGHRPAREHLREVLAVVGLGVEVAAGGRPLG